MINHLDLSQVLHFLIEMSIFNSSLTNHDSLYETFEILFLLFIQSLTMMHQRIMKNRENNTKR